MDIPMLSMSLSQTRLQESVGVSLLKMNLNNQAEEGKKMCDMLESAPSPENLGNTIDTYA